MDGTELLLIGTVVLAILLVARTFRRGRDRALDEPPLRFRVGRMLMLRETAEGFPRGTVVKVVSVGVEGGSACVVEPYAPALDGTPAFQASGVRLTVPKVGLAESLPEFRLGRD